MLIVGPYAIQSDYVRSERNHALLCSKSLVPVLWLGAAGHSGCPSPYVIGL
jgi:hypothetical protein